MEGPVTELLRPDICVIGTGPGAIEVAVAAAVFAVPVVLVDDRASGGVRRRTELRAGAESRREGGP